MNAIKAVSVLLLILVVQGCLRPYLAARAVVNARVGKDDVVRYGVSPEFAVQVGKLTGDPLITAEDLKISPYRDTSLLEFRSTAATSSAAVHRVSAMIAVMREHFDPILREELVKEIEPSLANNKMSEQEKELARKIQRGIPRASVEVVDPPAPITE